MIVSPDRGALAFCVLFLFSVRQVLLGAEDHADRQAVVQGHVGQLFRVGEEVFVEVRRLRDQDWEQDERGRSEDSTAF